MIKVKVKVVGIDQSTLAPVVIITDQSELAFIPIVIGPSEAHSIALELSGNTPPRPMTHDLMRTVVETLGGRVDKVIISELKDDTYYARLYVEKDGKMLNLDCRPSDAIALALRVDAPIYISDDVAATAMIQQDENGDDEMEEFRRFLDALSPEDFKKNLS